MKTLKFSAVALANLEEIHARIAEDDPYRADTFTESLLQRIDLASLLPLSSPQIPGGEASERYISHADYIITYTIKDDSVIVTKVFHAALDLTAEAVH